MRLGCRWQTARRMCSCSGVADLKYPSHMCYRAEFVRSFCVKGCRHKYRKTPKLGSPGTLTALLGGRQDTRLFPTCYRIGSSVTKHVRWNRRELQKITERWGLGWPLRFSPRVILPNLVVQGQTVRASLRRSPKILTPRIPPSLKVIGTDTDWSASYDFLLTFHSNCSRPISYRFRDKRQFKLKVANFSHPRVFCAHTEGIWNLVSTPRVKN